MATATAATAAMRERCAVAPDVTERGCSRRCARDDDVGGGGGNERGCSRRSRH